MLITGKSVMERLPWSRGVVVNFDLGKLFPGPRSQQRGSLRPRARRVVVLGWVREVRFVMPNPAFGGNLGQKIN